MLRKITIRNYVAHTGFRLPKFPLSYQIFGVPLGRAPVVLVTHALTGNSSVSGSDGWWNGLIGPGKTIDTNEFTILCFDIPGNGYNGFLFKDYERISVSDVANWFVEGLQRLEIESVFAGIGGSLGGTILWEMALLKPKLFEILIPIACDWKATDWLLAQTAVQREILDNSRNPVHDARIHAMTFYRSPQSLKAKFGRKKNNKDVFLVEDWLFHHGVLLKNRFHLLSYKLMNHLLQTMGIKDFYSKASQIEGKILLVGINSDGFFLNSEIKQTWHLLKNLKDDVFYAEIDSIHGHDAFLIEYEPLESILKNIFRIKSEHIKEENYEYTTVG